MRGREGIIAYGMRMMVRVDVFFFFFKQKTAYEIKNVTGVQTCALPIYSFGVKLKF